MRRKTLLSSLVVPVVLTWLMTAQPALSQESREAVEKPTAKRAIRGRLPAYFAAVVTRKQRAEIYEIQAKFQEQIEQLREQIAGLEGTRDRQVDGVLSADQLEEVSQKRAAAEKRRQSRSQANARRSSSPAESEAKD